MSESKRRETVAKVGTGVPGLDDILRGGLTPNRLYLVEGDPGAGKTTLAMQYLMEGVRRGEPGLYVTLAETESELRAVAGSHGWNLDGIAICELVPSEEKLSPEQELTMFHPSEVELGETTRRMLSEVEKIQAKRVVLDSLSELRLVAQSSLRYRRQILALKQYFAGRDCTVLLLDDRTAEGEDSQLQSIAHGVVTLEQISTHLGAERRRLRIAKMRGIPFRGGLHDFTIRTGGLEVYPRLIAAEHHPGFADGDLSSGNAQLDQLLGGGLPAGTSTLLIGPAGTGKSVTATQFVVAAAQRGQRSSMFIFDENMSTLTTRSRKIGLDLQPYVKSGMVTLQQIDPAELSPGEFVNIIRRAVSGSSDPKRNAQVVVIDSLNGYLNAMSEEKYLTAQLHELLAYLGQLGVLTIMTVAQSGVMGTQMQASVDTTYLADNVVLFRYFESYGSIKRSISVMKKRSGYHEATIRELRIGARGIEISEPLTDFQGVLSGVPQYLGNRSELIEGGGSDGK